LLHGLILMVPLLQVVGCSAIAPYRRTSPWRPMGVNARDLAAMAANPTDLVRGRGAPGAPGAIAVTPVAGLRRGKAIPLPKSGLGRIGSGR